MLAPGRKGGAARTHAPHEISCPSPFGFAEEVRVERRYHNPYKYWVSGFFFEVALFLAFMASLAVMAFVVMRLAG